MWKELRASHRGFEAGRCLGLITCLVETGYGSNEKHATKANHVVVDLRSAVAASCTAAERIVPDRRIMAAGVDPAAARPANLQAQYWS